ncbi:MAG TPA: ZIP family metal transporter [Bacteroidota bacterium]|nr:ZIP family metal transporter [Bacteroidota bacterium]
MTKTTVYILLLGLVAALAELTGGGFVLLRKKWPRTVQEYLLALSAGFILALVFMELIPESLHAVGMKAPLIMLAGYAVLHFFEHTIVGHLHFGEETHDEVMLSGVASYSTFAGLFIHAFFDGFAISVGMRYDFYLGLLIFFAVFLHKIPEGLTIATVMIAAARRRMVAFLASVAIGVATMLGILSVFLLSNVDEAFVGSAFAFSAGIALYVGASDLIPEINHSKKRVIPLLVFGGMLLFYGGTLIFGAGHVH